MINALIMFEHNECENFVQIAFLHENNQKIFENSCKKITYFLYNNFFQVIYVLNILYLLNTKFFQF